MKDRIAQLMKEENLTPGKLADLLGVQPSNISHLLSGRNNPGFDFIASVLKGFPSLNPYWLILGQMPMYNNAGSSNVSSIQKERVETTESLSYSNAINAYDTPVKPVNAGSKAVHLHSAISNNALNNNSDVTIDQVVTLLSDGTFRSYNPAK